MFKVSMLLKSARFYSAVTLAALALSMNSLSLKGQDMEEEDAAAGDQTVCLKCTINVLTGTINCVKIACPK